MCPSKLALLILFGMHPKIAALLGNDKYPNSCVATGECDWFYGGQ
jgi:hypothetical protein